MRAWLAQATVRALFGMGAATLAYVRSSMTQEVTVCRTLIPLSELIVPYQFQDTRRWYPTMGERGRQDPGEVYRRISVDDAKAMLEEGESVVIDVRQPNEWVAGHIAGAQHIPVDEVLNRVDELPKDKNLLFVCAQGVRSGLACEMAAAMGLPQEILYNIEEGTPTWIEKNYPTEYGA